MSTPAIAPAVAARHMPAERLFQPVELGRYDLAQRMVMAPLTRSRARQPGNVPSPLNACYRGRSELMPSVNSYARKKQVVARPKQV